MEDIESELQRMRRDNLILQQELEEAQEALDAISRGEVDALLVNGPQGEQVFTLRSADYTYRILIEKLQDGAAVLDGSGSLLYINSYLERLLAIPSERLIGSDFLSLVHPDDQDHVAALLKAAKFEANPQAEADSGSEPIELQLIGSRGAILPVQVAAGPVFFDQTPVICMAVTDLRPRQRHEDLLSEERLSRSIISQTAEALIVCDNRGIIIRVSRAAVDLAGAGCLNMPFDAMFHLQVDCRNGKGKKSASEYKPDYQLLSIAIIIGGKTLHSCEARLGTSEADYRYFTVSAGPMTNESEEVIGAIVTMVDITARRKMEDELRRQYSFINTILDNLPIGLVVSRLDSGMVSYHNRRFAEICGWPVHDAKEIERFFDRLFPDSRYRDELKSRIIEGINSGDTRRMRFDNIQIIGKDGVQRIISAKNILLKGRNVMVSTVQDETQRAAAERKLAESEHQYRLIAENTVDSIWVMDMDFNFSFVNPAVEVMFGIPPEDFIQGNLRDICHPEQFAQFEELVDRKAADPAGDSQFVFEARLQARGDREVPVEIHGAVIFDSTGEPVSLQCVTRDIGERLSLEQRLRQAQKMEAVGRLAGGVAHDYNNMLSVILGYAEMALDQTAPEDPLHDDLNQILAAAYRSRDITSQLLAFARRQPIAPVDLDLNKTVRGMLGMLSPLIGEDIQLIWKPGDTRWHIRMDPSQIDQVLVNLCVNARDAISGIGEITISTDSVYMDERSCLEVEGCYPGKFVRLTVADNGCGMDNATLENIFEPFFTTKQGGTARGQGTGLGLATVYGIVTQNFGFIEVDSEPGSGAVFSLYFPSFLSADELESQEYAAALVESLPAGKGEVILVVEDDSANLKMTARMLKNLGYEVLTAITPGDSLAMVREHGERISLLLTDVIMPEMNGRDLALLLGETLPGLKVLFMSGYTADVIAHHGVLDEHVHFIQKPFSVNVLAEKVREALDS